MAAGVSGTASTQRTTARARRWGAAALLAGVALLGACAPAIGTLTPQQQVDQLVAFVERTRGHKFPTKPVVEFIPDATFQQHVLDSLSAVQPGLDKDEVAFQALGWMPTTDDLYAKYRVAFGTSVVGFYDPVTKVLEVRGSQLTAYRREVVVHELTHALDDQLFDLNESYGDGVLSEQQLSFLVAVEGDAVRSQQAWSKQASPADQLAALSEQLSFQIDPNIFSVPIALLSISQTPYLQGPAFVNGLGGNAGIDTMLSTRYPDTAEEAWNPAKYLADEGAAAVPTPPADGTVVNSGSWGRFNMSLVLANGVDIDASLNPVTDGWAGDAYVTWTTATQRCIRIDTRSDTPTQAASLRAALDTWSNGHGGVTVAATDTTTTRLTSCR